MKLIQYIIISSIFFVGCGGGGGSSSQDDFVGAANLRLEVSPQEIDAGDQARVRVQISDVNKNGISLKIRFPEALRFVPASASLDKGENAVSLEPAISQTIDNYHYLVFYLASSLFTNNNSRDLILVLEGVSNKEDGMIEVDADVDDPLIDNSVEFDPDDPEFEAEDELYVTIIKGGSSRK